jgi:hypothetical protein
MLISSLCGLADEQTTRLAVWNEIRLNHAAESADKKRAHLQNTTIKQHIRKIIFCGKMIARTMLPAFQSMWVTLSM